MSDATKVTAFRFNATGMAQAKPLEAVPGGWYPVIIYDGEVKPGKGAGGGKRMTLWHRILWPGNEYDQAVIVDGQMVEHTNATTQRIAQEVLSSLCHSTGVIDIQDLKQFFNIPVMVLVAYVGPRTENAGKPNEKQHPAKNEVKAYKAMAGASIPGAMGMVAPAALGAPPVGGYTAPAVNTYPAPLPGAPPVGLPAGPYATVAPAPAAPLPVTPAPAPAPVEVFPPAPWQVHPQSAGYCWNPQTQEVLDDATLRNRYAPSPGAVAAAVAPVVAPAPALQPAPAPAPVPQAAPVPAGLPPGWAIHPQSAEHAWNATTGQVATIAEVMAMGNAPVLPGGMTAPAPAPAQSMPATASPSSGDVAPWLRGAPGAPVA